MATSQASAGSPSGTPENAAEQVASQKMRQYFPAYRPLDLQMRSNRMLIAIPAVNRLGNRVDCMAYVRKVTRRDGSFFYEVDVPRFN